MSTDQLPKELIKIHLFYTIQKVETQIQETQFFMSKLSNWSLLYQEMKRRIQELEITKKMFFEQLESLGAKDVL